jgi:hypothetical protein
VRAAFDQIVGSHEIVGIVGDLIEDGPAAAAAPYVYACEPAGSSPDPQYVVRTEGDSRAVMASVRDAVAKSEAAKAPDGAPATPPRSNCRTNCRVFWYGIK